MKWVIVVTLSLMLIVACNPSIDIRAIQTSEAVTANAAVRTETLAPTLTPTLTDTPTSTPTPSMTPTATSTATSTATAVPSVTPSPTKVRTKSPTRTLAPARTSTQVAPTPLSTPTLQSTQPSSSSGNQSCPTTDRTEFAQDAIQVNHYLDGHLEYVYGLFAWGAEMPDTNQTVWYGGRIASVNGNSVEVILFKDGFQGGKHILIEDRRLALSLTPSTIIQMYKPDIYEQSNGRWEAVGERFSQACVADLTYIPNMAARLHADSGGILIEIRFSR